MLGFFTRVAVTTGIAALAFATPSPAAAAQRDVLRYPQTSILKQLRHLVTIGSTVDPLNGDQNPYGLGIAPISKGLLEAGDLVVCNFNDAANVQGTGTTIVALHPVPGASPLHVAGDPSLLGCTELALGPTDGIWAAAFAADDNPIFSPGGTLLTTLPGGPWVQPFGQAFGPPAVPRSLGTFYESNAGNGSIVRISIFPGPLFQFSTIATGFAVNNGPPGSILGPSGLQYDVTNDRLYVVDGANNTVVALENASRLPPNGIRVRRNGTFAGAAALFARLVYAGAPLNGPISSALMPDGHLVVGNTLDPNGFNLMIELTPNGHVLDVENVDSGAAGSIFGMVATGHGDADTKL